MVQIVFADRNGRHELDVRIEVPGATVADLGRALVEGAGDRALVVDGQPAGPARRLDEVGLRQGALVLFAGPNDRPGPDPSLRNVVVNELVVVGGLDAGRRVRLPAGTAVVGRAAGCDIALRDGTLSRRHAALTVSAGGAVEVADLGSRNGTWRGDRRIGGPEPLPPGTPVRIGGLDVEVRPGGDDRAGGDPGVHLGAGGSRAFNRPPRPAVAPGPAPLVPPRAPRSEGVGVPFSPLGMLAPVVVAAVMFAVTHRPEMLLFSAMTPAIGAAHVLDGRRRGRRTERRERARVAAELAAFREGLAAAAGDERARRRRTLPDPGELTRRAALGSTALWERRPHHPDFLVLRAGVGDVPWSPPVASDGPGDAAREVVAAVAGAACLADAPVPLDLSGGGVVGIVGDRGAALALARSLVCQAAVLHGPADLPVMVLAGAGAAADWDWAKWLPHTRDRGGATRLLAAGTAACAGLVDAHVAAAEGRAGTLLVVVDGESLTGGRRAPARPLLRGDTGPVAGIVVAPSADRLPARCTAVVTMTGADGGADLARPAGGDAVPGFFAAGMADDVARECARALAGFDDPELEAAGAGLPDRVRLLPLLDLDRATPAAVAARWAAGGHDPRPAAPLGVTGDGPLVVDLVADGPHALVGGTTGAGKSELLRTLVAGLAATVSPDHLTFLLVDFKGGGAFDACARLPHTVGLVTDLDEHLAARALRCLEAELRRRERLLRAAGATDLAGYRPPGGNREPLPRLVVVIDEFATLRAELPDFVDALVGVAQRGRSLGVHLVLATQRPQGAVSENIRANTNLRIALRVQDAGDSRDVIDVPDAAVLPRHAPGRAYVRLGPGEVVAVQTALATAARGPAPPAPVDVAPFVFGAEPRAPAAAAPPIAPGRADHGGADPGGSDLGALVEAASVAFARSGRPRPRRPWPDPLPGEVDLDALLDATEADGPPAFTPLALADDPEAQAQYPVGWHRADGNLVLYGIGGSGTTTALATVALALARTCRPDDLHLYVLDHGAGELAGLAGLPHVGGVIGAGERERQARLIRHLRAELDRRRAAGGGGDARPDIVTLIDGWSAFAAGYDDLAGASLWDAVVRVFADGPGVGLFTVVAADRGAAVPGSLAALVRQRWALRLADRGDYGAFGIRGADVPAMVPGRAVVCASGQVVQIARPAGGLAAAVRRVAAAHPGTAGRPPAAIEPLPTHVRLADLGAAARLGSRPWTIPVGLGERTRTPVALAAYQGEHVLVAGPARSGRSTALATVATACRAAGPGVRVVAVAGPRSPLGADPAVDEAVAPADLGDRLAAGTGPLLVLVDDADTIDDVGGVLEALATADRADLLVVAAGRNDALRTGYTHWTRALRRSKLGLLLRPDVDLDGDLLGAPIPRRAPVGMAPGRGYLAAAGAAEMIQVAMPR